MNLSIRTKAALLALGLLALNSSTASAQQVLKPGLPAQPVLTPRLPIRPPSTPSPEERHRQRIERARQTAIMAVNNTAPGSGPGETHAPERVRRFVTCFNPLPAVGPGETQNRRSDNGAPDVSIRSRQWAREKRGAN